MEKFIPMYVPTHKIPPAMLDEDVSKQLIVLDEFLHRSLSLSEIIARTGATRLTSQHIIHDVISSPSRRYEENKNLRDYDFHTMFDTGIYKLNRWERFVDSLVIRMTINTLGEGMIMGGPVPEGMRSLKSYTNGTPYWCKVIERGRCRKVELGTAVTYNDFEYVPPFDYRNR